MIPLLSFKILSVMVGVLSQIEIWESNMQMGNIGLVKNVEKTSFITEMSIATNGSGCLRGAIDKSKNSNDEK